MGVSFNPNDAVQGGLLNDVNVVVLTSRVEMFDYGGTQQDAVPALHWQLKDVETEEVYDQYWSVGAAKDWVPSEDGKELLPVGGQTALKKSSNVMVMLEYLLSSGFPADKLGDDVSVLEGLQCHMIRIPAPKRSGLPEKQKTGDDGKAFEKTVLVVDRIDKFPWEKAAPKGKPAGAATPPGAPKTAGKGGAAGKAAPAPTTQAPNTDLAELVQTTLAMILGENNGGMAKANLPTAVYKALIGNPLQNKAVALVSKPGSLEELGFVVVDGVVGFGG